MKKTKILYWTFTGLFAFMMLGSAIPDIISAPIAQQGFRDMHMPPYLLPFLGIAKALGVLAILVPGYNRIKEWAYAGLMFDLLGATWCIIASGHPVANWVPMALPIVLGICSYTYHHRRLKQRASGAVANAPAVPVNAAAA